MGDLPEITFEFKPPQTEAEAFFGYSRWVARCAGIAAIGRTQEKALEALHLKFKVMKLAKEMTEPRGLT